VGAEGGKAWLVRIKSWAKAKAERSNSEPNESCSLSFTNELSMVRGVGVGKDLEGSDFGVGAAVETDKEGRVTGTGTGESARGLGKGSKGSEEKEATGRDGADTAEGASVEDAALARAAIDENGEIDNEPLRSASPLAGCDVDSGDNRANEEEGGA